MLTQTILWTAVPNGVSAGQLQIVCLASPRLASVNQSGKLTLDLYPDQVNWAQTAHPTQLSFAVQLAGQPAVPATRVSAPPVPHLWPALFPPSTPVRPFAYTDHSGQNIRSYPVANVVDAIAGLYRETATYSPTQFPLADVLLGDLLPGRIRVDGRDERRLLDQLDGRFGPRTRALPPGPADPLTDFLQLKRFHLVKPGFAQVPPQPTPVPLDFHQVLALLMQFPAIQRLLGLVIDLTVPIPAGLPPDPTVQLVPVWQPSLAGTVNQTPKTAATYGLDRFLPKDVGDLSAGMLNLSGSGFGVTPVDVDGSGLKLRQAADNVHRAWHIARSQDTPDRYSLPALRGSGLAVFRTGQAVAQASGFAAAKQDFDLLAGGGVPTLDARSLFQGVRWHVYDVQSGRWFSLCRRTGEYEFLGPHETVPVGGAPGGWEEGTVTAAATQRVDGTGDDLYLAEYLCRWQGESLVARRPGNSLHKDPGQPPTDETAPPPDEFKLHATFRPAPGSLPPLRYGRRYRFRAYATFVGGAGLPYDPQDMSSNFGKTTAEITYARLDPVPAPEVVLRVPPGAGESVHRLVIRTDYDIVTPAIPTERHLLPAKIAQLAAEQHGMFDTPGGLSAAAYQMIVSRADGTLTGGGSDTDPAFDTDQLVVPWLPDPFSRRAALYGLPGAPAGATLAADFGTPAPTWPDLQALRLRLVEGTAAPKWPAPGEPRVLQVAIDKGDTAEVLLSAGLDPADLRAMQVWRWVEYGPALPPAVLEARRSEALDGRNWLLTPPTRLTLVCAVRRPLVAPTFSQPAAARPALGETAATLTDTLTVSRKSTVGVDITAQWTDPMDTVDGPVWTPAMPVVKTADLGEVRVAKAGAQLPEGQLAVSRRHDFGDTKYHAVTYTAVGKSRFAEYFVEEKDVVLGQGGTAVVDLRGVAPHSEEVRSGAIALVRGTDYTLAYPTGVLTALTVPAGSTLHVRYLPTVSRPGAGVGVPVLSSARPAVPRPVYVVPTFGWQVQAPSTDPAVPPAALLSRRLGNGLRVYLDRPWWSSGDDEQLAVVVSSTPGIQDQLRRYVTQWGGDPVFRSGPPPTDLPKQDQFPLRVSSPGAVALAELAGTLVSVAPHAVAPDLQRRLWYCDIVLTPGQAYTPFVRLALARYQPHAMPGAELSSVVLTDFAQLAPDRWVTLNYSGATGVAVTVVGQSYQKTAGSPLAFGRVVVTVERRDPKIPGDLGWYPAGEWVLNQGVGWQQGHTMWSGPVQLPVPRGSEPMRLVVREYERFTAAQTGDRVVFTDVVPVS